MIKVGTAFIYVIGSTNRPQKIGMTSGDPLRRLSERLIPLAQVHPYVEIHTTDCLRITVE